MTDLSSPAAQALTAYLEAMPQNSVGAYDTSSREIVRSESRGVTVRLELTSRNTLRMVTRIKALGRPDLVTARGVRVTELSAELAAHVNTLMPQARAEAPKPLGVAELPPEEEPGF